MLKKSIKCIVYKIFFVTSGLCGSLGNKKTSAFSASPVSFLTGQVLREIRDCTIKKLI